MTRHLALPLRVADGSALAELVQDGPGEVGQSVQVLLKTRPGERRSEPQYGSADPLGYPLAHQPIDYGAIALWEPRAATTDGVQITAVIHPRAVQPQ